MQMPKPYKLTAEDIADMRAAAMLTHVHPVLPAYVPHEPIPDMTHAVLYRYPYARVQRKLKASRPRKLRWRYASFAFMPLTARDRGKYHQPLALGWVHRENMRNPRK